MPAESTVKVAVRHGLTIATVYSTSAAADMQVELLVADVVTL